ncbi:hypothetical protein JA1_000415 [Spathaspora sp. JA1]|nr:hypothetical protein JA1_000415 [Spathaspora sp. JA1]
MTEMSENNRVSRLFRFKNGLTSTDQLSQYSEESEPQHSQHSSHQQRSPPRRNSSIRLFRKTSNLSTNGDRSSKIISNIFNRSKSSVERESIYILPNDSKNWGTGFQLNTPFIHPQSPTTLESFADSDSETSDDETDSILMDLKTTTYNSIFHEQTIESNYTLYHTEARISCDHLIHTLSSIEEKIQTKPQLSIDTTLQDHQHQQPQKTEEEFTSGLSGISSSNIYSFSPDTLASEDNYPEPNIENKEQSPCQEITSKGLQNNKELSSHRENTEGNHSNKDNKHVNIEGKLPQLSSNKPSFETRHDRSCTSVSCFDEKESISEDDPISKSGTFDTNTPGTSQEDIHYLSKSSNGNEKHNDITLVAQELRSNESDSKSKQSSVIFKWFSKVLRKNRSKGHAAPIITT